MKKNFCLFFLVLSVVFLKPLFSAHTLYSEIGDIDISVIGDLCTSDECDSFIVWAKEHGLEKPNFNEEHRKCERLHVVNTLMSDLIMKRLKPFLPQTIEVDGIRFSLHRFTHHWRTVHYVEGGHFSPHYDGSKMTADGKLTVFTFQMYLNDAFKDGSTRFYLSYQPKRSEAHDIAYGQVQDFAPQSPPEFKVSPKTGTALLFNHTHNLLHDGESVSGEKWILRGDILYEVVEEDREKLEALKSSDATFWDWNVAKRGGTKSYAGETWFCKCGEDQCGHNLSFSQEIPVEYAQDSTLLNEHTRVIVMSGKRAVGKDFIADRLTEILNQNGIRAHKTSLGMFNKKLYAKKKGIDFQRLSTDRGFKEARRFSLVNHHMEMDKQDPEWAIKLVKKEAEEKNPNVLIVSDLRLKKDVARLKEIYPDLQVIRIDASNEARLARGFMPDEEKDRLITETDMDDYNEFDARFDNSGEIKAIDEWLNGTVLPRCVRTH